MFTRFLTAVLAATSLALPATGQEPAPADPTSLTLVAASPETGDQPAIPETGDAVTVQPAYGDGEWRFLDPGEGLEYTKPKPRPSKPTVAPLPDMPFPVDQYGPISNLALDRQFLSPMMVPGGDTGDWWTFYTGDRNSRVHRPANSVNVNTLKPPTTSYLVNANNTHGDQQLLAGAYAAKTNGQVILTYPNQPTPQPTTNTTYTFTPTLNPNAQPIPGNDPAAQSFWLAKHTTPKPTTPALTVSSDPRHVVDALAAGPLSGIFNRPLIMAPSTDETINKAMTDWLATRHVTAFGPANKVWLGPNPITHPKP